MGFIVDYDDNLSVELRQESLIIHTGDADRDYADKDQFGHGHAELGYSTVSKFLFWLKQASSSVHLPPELRAAYSSLLNSTEPDTEASVSSRG